MRGFYKYPKRAPSNQRVHFCYLSNESFATLYFEDGKWYSYSGQSDDYDQPLIDVEVLYFQGHESRKVLGDINNNQ